MRTCTVLILLHREGIDYNLAKNLGRAANHDGSDGPADQDECRQDLQTALDLKRPSGLERVPGASDRGVCITNYEDLAPGGEEVGREKEARAVGRAFKTARWRDVKGKLTKAQKSHRSNQSKQRKAKRL